jgi:hypothetical protein
VDVADLHGVVSCIALDAIERLEASARAAGFTVLHVEAGGASDAAGLLAAVARDAASDDPSRAWNWDAVSDLLWQRLQGASGALVVLAGVDGLLPERLQDLLDAAGALRDLARTLSPAPCWTALAGVGPAFAV